jgi:EpsD family peptidyl-prolyl cis-trans isomerase
LLLVPLAACGQIPGYGGASEPEGQVIAVVNGEEITSSQLKAEAEATGRDVKDPAARSELLSTVIDRHMKATAAVERGLDRNPQYLSHKRRLEQEMLAQLFLRSKAQSAEEPDLHAARMFILKNPKLFEEAEQLVVDRISFSPADAVTQAEIDAAESLGAVERLLASKGARAERRTIAMDPATLPVEMGSQVVKLKVGEVFFARQGQTGVFAAIVERRPAPVPPREQVARARTILKRQKAEEAAAAAARDLRRSAKIQYQEGYGPPKGEVKGSAK